MTAHTLPQGLRKAIPRVYCLGHGYQWVLLCAVTDAVLDMGHERNKWRASEAAKRAAQAWRTGKEKHD